MKFSVFADLHHHPGVFDGGTDADLDFILRRAQEAGSSFIIHAGDFCHGPSHVMDYVQKYNHFPIPAYHALGNHDTDATPYEETLKAYRMPDGHYFFDCEGYRFIVCDPNYLLLDGEYVHYSMGNYYPHGAHLNHMPPDQLAWLKETIESAPHPCVLISHQSFERENKGVKEWEAVQQIFRGANRRRPHAVLLCINGHYHRDNIRILDGVCYLDLNSSSFDWVENEHDCYPKELCEKTRLLNHTVVYNDPIHAVITLEGSTITVEGMESSMFMGINRAETKVNPLFDGMGRPVVPRVQNAKITLG